MSPIWIIFSMSKLIFFSTLTYLIANPFDNWVEQNQNVIKEKISQQKQQDLENSIRDDPNVQLILNDFEANIIDSSIKEKNEPS